ncbi:hypothetical protein HPB47_025599, partial [Ixodes persulcatus]
PFFLNREKAPKREYFTADGYHIHRILGVRKMSKLIKVHVKKKLGAQWIGVRHCLELPQIYSCSHCTLVQPLQDKRPQAVVVPELHPPPITMPASHRLPANDTILAVPDLPNRMTGEEGLEEVPAVGSWYICRTVAAYSPSVFLDLNSVRMALRFFFFVLLKYCSHAAAKAVSRVMLTVLALLTYLTTQRFINAQQFQLRLRRPLEQWLTGWRGPKRRRWRICSTWVGIPEEENKLLLDKYNQSDRYDYEQMQPIQAAAPEVQTTLLDFSGRSAQKIR